MIVRNNRHSALRVTTVLVALLAAFSLVTACSKDEPRHVRTGPLPEATKLIDASAKAAKELHHVQLELSVNGTVPKLPVETLSAYLTNQPAFAAQGDAKVRLGGSGAAAPVTFVVLDGRLWAQFSPGTPYRDSAAAADVYDASAILDPERGIAKLLTSVRDPKVEGREVIGDTDSVRITGTLPGSALAGIVPKAELGDSPVTFWIQEDAPNNLVRAEISFDTGTLTVTLSDWGVKRDLINPKSGS